MEYTDPVSQGTNEKILVTSQSILLFPTIAHDISTAARSDDLNYLSKQSIRPNTSL